jgi:hypothetical protein
MQVLLIYLRSMNLKLQQKSLNVFIESMAFNRSADLTKKAEVCFIQ